jgi:hypothetical protein
MEGPKKMMKMKTPKRVEAEAKLEAWEIYKNAVAFYKEDLLKKKEELQASAEAMAIGKHLIGEDPPFPVGAFKPVEPFKVGELVRFRRAPGESMVISAVEGRYYEVQNLYDPNQRQATRHEDLEYDPKGFFIGEQVIVGADTSFPQEGIFKGYSTVEHTQVYARVYIVSPVNPHHVLVPVSELRLLKPRSSWLGPTDYTMTGRPSESLKAAVSAAVQGIPIDLIDEILTELVK